MPAFSIWCLGGGGIFFQLRLKAGVALDYETNPNLDVTVRAASGASQGFSIKVLDAAEAPVITSNGGGNRATVQVVRNQTEVTTVQAADPDAGAKLTYTIIGGTDRKLFEIDAATGVLSFKQAPALGGKKSFDVIVEVADNTRSKPVDLPSGTRTFAAPLTDTQFITVSVQDAPVVTQAPYNLTANGFTFRATDPDGNALSVLLNGVAVPSTRNLDGSITVSFDPEQALQAGMVTVSDGLFAVDLIRVYGPQNAPIITSNGSGATASVSAYAGVSAVTTVTATDQDGDTPTYSIVGGEDADKFTINASTGALAFVQAPANRLGQLSFDVIVQASDAGGYFALSPSGVPTWQAPLNDTQQITVQLVNTAPTAVADGLTVDEGGTVTVLNGDATSVLANDTDPDGDTLIAVLVTDVVNGSLTLNTDGTFSYTHDGSETTRDSFTYRVNDGTGDGNIVTVNIAVTPVNETPVVTQAPYDLTANGFTFRATDPDSNTLSVLLNGVAVPSTKNLDGSITVSFDPEQALQAGMVTVSDGLFAVDLIRVYGLQSAPVITSNGSGATASVLVYAGVSAVTTVTATDQDGDTPTYSIVGGEDADKFTINASTGALAFVQAPANRLGQLSFDVIVQASDAGGYFALSPSGVPTWQAPLNDTQQITVELANRAPVAAADSFTVQEGETATFLSSGRASVLANDTDSDGESLIAVLVTDAVNGSLTLNTDGTFSYTHDGSETTRDSFTYRANDGTGDGNIVTVNITVTPYNDSPVVTAPYDITANSFSFNATDPEGYPLTVASYAWPSSLPFESAVVDDTFTVTFVPGQAAKEGSIQVNDDKWGAAVSQVLLGTSGNDTLVQEIDYNLLVYGFAGDDRYLNVTPANLARIGEGAGGGDDTAIFSRSGAVTAVDAIEHYALASGDDTITFSGVASIRAAQTVDLGSGGADTVILTSSAYAGGTSSAVEVAGFVAGSGSGADKIKLLDQDITEVVLNFQPGGTSSDVAGGVYLDLFRGVTATLTDTAAGGSVEQVVAQFYGSFSLQPGSRLVTGMSDGEGSVGFYEVRLNGGLTGGSFSDLNSSNFTVQHLTTLVGVDINAFVASNFI